MGSADLQIGCPVGLQTHKRRVPLVPLFWKITNLKARKCRLPHRRWLQIISGILLL